MSDAIPQITAGKTVNFNVTVRGGDGKPVSIAGAAAIEWRLKQAPAAAVAATKSLGAGIAITDGAGGKFTIAVLPADTANLAGDYWSVAEITAANGDVTDVICERITIKPNFIS